MGVVAATLFTERSKLLRMDLQPVKPEIWTSTNAYNLSTPNVNVGPIFIVVGLTWSLCWIDSY